jgi:hypothetical protein
MIAEGGNMGRFFKRECPYYVLNNMLKSLIKDIDSLKKEK